MDRTILPNVAYPIKKSGLLCMAAGRNLISQDGLQSVLDLKFQVHRAPSHSSVNAAQILLARCLDRVPTSGAVDKYPSKCIGVQVRF